MRTVDAPVSRATAGELTPYLLSGDDLQFYRAAWRRADNVIVLPHGASPRRGGSRRCGDARSDAAWLGAFRFAPGDALALEFGEKKMRFWRSDRTQVTRASGVPFELDTPWSIADLPNLRWQESADVIWFVDGSHKMQELRRPALDTFTLADAVMLDGPYYATNGVTANVAAVTGTGQGDHAVAFTNDTLDVSATPSPDIGRHFRIKGGSSENDGWAWGVIKTVSDAKTMVVTFSSGIDSGFGGSTSLWRLGLFGAKTGQPSAICIHQQRLALGSNCAGQFPRVDLGKTGDFLTFTPGVADDQGIQDVVDGDEVPIIRDLRSNRELFAFTTGGVHRITTSDSTSALTPLNQDVTMIEPTGCGTARAVRARRAVLYADPQGGSLGEIAYDIRENGPRYRELSVRAEHLFHDSPIVCMEWADKPWGQLVAVRADGSLVFTTYNPEQDTIALTPGVLGGPDARVLSVTTLPTSAGNDVWLLVDRGGMRSIEQLAPLLKHTENDWLAVNLDAAVTQVDAPNATLTLQSTVAGVQTWKASANVFANGDKGKAIRTQLYRGRNQRYNVHHWSRRSGTIASVVDASTITIRIDGAALSLPSPMAAGDWGRTFTAVTGLGHLEGESVYAWAEGQTFGPFVVTGGAITLANPAARATVGYAYRSAWQAMPPAPPTAKGSAVGRPTMVVADRVRVLRSADLRQLDYKGAAKGLVPVEAGARATDQPRPVFTGDLKLAADQITHAAPVAPVIVCDGAGPACVLAMVPTVGVGEVG